LLGVLDVFKPWEMHYCKICKVENIVKEKVRDGKEGLMDNQSALQEIILGKRRFGN
jgi:hypothetical protein